MEVQIMTELSGNWWSCAQMKVTPEQLRQKADKLRQKILQIQKEFETLEKGIDGTVSYWVGEAGDTCREKYIAFQPEIEEIIRRLEEHVRDLNAMAGVYQEAEMAVKNVIEDLPANVII